MNKNWFEEYDPENQVGRRYRIEKHLFSQQGPFQKVDVYETTTHGRMLTLDDLVMTTDKDEFIYHDMITHVPLFTHPNPKNVLIIGGGDGGTAREVLRHPSVEKCTMVEIDGLVIEAAKQFLPKTSSELINPRLHLLVQDGVEFLKNTKEKFDVILVDSSDPIGPASPLFDHEFYKNIYRSLTEDGIVVSQNESPYYHQNMQKKLIEILRDIFPKVHLYTYTNLTYPGGCWAFSYAAKTLCPYRDFNRERVHLNCRYYSPQLHLAAFQLPAFVQKEYASLLTPLPPLTYEK